jgi:hypothetical protein
MSTLKNGAMAMVQFTGSDAPIVLARFVSDHDQLITWDPEFQWAEPHEYWEFFGTEITAPADEITVGERVYLTTEDPT